MNDVAEMCNTTTTAVTGITTTYDLTKKILLTGYRPKDEPGTIADLVRPNARAPQAEFYPENIEVEVDVTAGAPTTLTCYLAWDSAGDHVCTNPVTIPLTAGLTDTSLRGGSMTLNGTKIMPKDDTVITTNFDPGRLYLICKTDTGTVTMKRAVLTWTGHRSR